MHDDVLSSVRTNKMLNARFKKNQSLLRIPRPELLAAGIAVESKVVLSAAGKASNGVLGGESLEAGSKSSRSHLALEAKNVGSKTSNVRSSHGGTRDGVLSSN